MFFSCTIPTSFFLVNLYISVALMSLLSQAKGVCAGIERAAVYQPGSDASGEQPCQGKQTTTFIL